MFNKALSIIVKAVIRYVADSGAIQLVQVQINPFETRDRTPRSGEFGFTSNPPEGSIALVAFGNGDRSNGVIIGTEDPATRPRNLVSGEAMLYSAQGQRVYLSEAGIVIEANGLPVTVQNASTVTVHASTEIIADTPLLKCTGDIIDNSGTNKVSMAMMRGAHNTHIHPVRNVQGGSSTVNSDVPTVLE